MEFRDVSESELIKMRWSEPAPFAVYFYTPWCGTCKYGERMLSVVAAMEPGLNMVKSNVNFLPTVVQEWKIESVPCLVFVAERRITEKLYTMRSVEHLLTKVRERMG